MDLQPTTPAGIRFTALADEHAAVFRERAAAHDAAGSMPAENYEDMKRSGFIAAFVPEELGGLGLESLATPPWTAPSPAQKWTNN